MHQCVLAGAAIAAFPSLGRALVLLEGLPHAALVVLPLRALVVEHSALAGARIATVASLCLALL